MKIIALHDEKGAILAAVEVDSASSGGPVPVPVAAPGTSVDTFDVPASVHGYSLEEVCTQFRVDVGSKRLISVGKQ
jgi:hypothetical protein